MLRFTENKMDKDLWISYAFAIVVGAFLLGLILAILGVFNSYHLSDQTLNEICYNFTGTNGTTYNITSQGQLECITPTFGHTQNIIIKNNGGGR